MTTVQINAETERVSLTGWERFKVGSFRHTSGIRRLVALRCGLPLLRIGLNRARSGGLFHELTVSDPDAARLHNARATGATS